MNSTNIKNLTGPDYLLLLLYLNNKEPISGAIRLEKMMFIFVKEIKPLIVKKGFKCDKMPEFISYHFGPFSKDVYDQVEFFKTIEFVKVEDLHAKEDMIEVDDFVPMGNDSDCDSCYLEINGKYMKYTIQDKGIEYVEKEILPYLNDGIIEILEKFKYKITSLPPKSILRYVYSKYPKYTKKSLIKDKVL